MGYYNEDEDDDSSNKKEPKGSKSKTPVLDQFGKNLTTLAAEGKLDIIYGRDKEVARVAQILTRRTKNNPIIIGASGVGKTSIAMLLAQNIVNKTAPRHLHNKQIIEVDMGSIVSGTKFRGQFEERMKSIIAEVVSNSDIILFIDEIHTIIGAGGSSGSLDAANMLKPALTRGGFQIIGSTTLNEYRLIEKEGGLERRFQKVQLEPTSIEDTIKILNAIKGKYENHHKVVYTEEAIKACVSLTDRYINDRFLPDKAIDALDEVGSKVHLNLQTPNKIKEIENKLVEVNQLKIDSVKKQIYEDAGKYRDEERQLRIKLEVENKAWEESINVDRISITEDMVADVISAMANVPITKVNTVEKKSLANLQNRLENRVIGQLDAVIAASKAVKRSRTGVKDANKPLSFMFIGNSGVGKTLLAKALAEELFEGKKSLIRFDMSEYSEKINVSRLIGAAPGYVGFEQGGQLTEEVKRKPYSVLLFDEIEKAHPEVYNLFLQILDEGQLTDSNGVRVNFKNTIIIMTSNVGTRVVKDFGSGIGFGTDNISKSANENISTINKELKKKFAPEFLNRLDEIVYFKDLDKENVREVMKIELSIVIDRVAELGYKLVVTDSALSFLSDVGYTTENGARPAKRAIQTYVEDLLAEELIINENVKKDSQFTIDLIEGKLVIKTDVVNNVSVDNSVVKKTTKKKTIK